MVYHSGKAPFFKHAHSRNISELEDEICFIEKVPVWLTAESDASSFAPYRIRTPSPGSMKGKDLREQIERMYPGIDVKVLSENLPLAQLRLKHTP